MGIAGAGAGFIFLLFFALLGGLIFIGLWLYRRHYLRKKTHPSSLHILLLNSFMTIAIVPILLLLTSVLTHKIGRLFINQQQLEIDKKHFIQLSSALPFGEIIIPEDSWINVKEATSYSSQDFSDIRQGLYRARFSKPIEIAKFPVAAFETTYRGILIELADEYSYELEDKEQICAKGWVVRLIYSEGTDQETFYQDQTGSWFTPSKWRIDRCFQTTGGVTVIAIDPKFGVYVLKPISYEN